MQCVVCKLQNQNNFHNSNEQIPTTATVSISIQHITFMDLSEESSSHQSQLRCSYHDCVMPQRKQQSKSSKNLQINTKTYHHVLAYKCLSLHLLLTLREKLLHSVLI